MNKEELINLLNSSEELDKYIITKEKNILFEILGMIEPKKFLALSEEFKENEIFRINKQSNGNFKSFKTFSNMHRIDLQYLKNSEKIIPSKKINMHLSKEIIEQYKKANTTATNYVNVNDFLIPYDKIYLNSQFNYFNSIIAVNSF